MATTCCGQRRGCRPHAWVGWACSPCAPPTHVAGRPARRRATTRPSFSRASHRVRGVPVPRRPGARSRACLHEPSPTEARTCQTLSVTRRKPETAPRAHTHKRCGPRGHPYRMPRQPVLEVYRAHDRVLCKWNDGSTRGCTQKHTHSPCARRVLPPPSRPAGTHRRCPPPPSTRRPR